MTPPVKAALISEVGALLYILAWVIAMQWALEYMQGTPEKAWVARAWRWWQDGGQRRWERTAAVYNRPGIPEPTPGDLA